MDKKRLLLAIEHQRERLEHAVRTKNQNMIDESWSKLVQLYVALADLEINELFRRGA